MAVIHRAQIVPTKAEIIAAWLPAQPWAGGADRVELIGAYRFDDPAGEVGIETHLVRTADGVLQVPLTYRGARLNGADPHLLGTMEHSHLGRRWVYDGCGDPLYAAVLAAVIRGGGREAEEWMEGDGRPTRREASVQVRGEPGESRIAPATHPTATAVVAGDLQLVVLRSVGTDIGRAGAGTLTGTWRGQDEPALLAYAAG